ncbi:hypothetical protein DFH09DRAFT_1097376 [Mycena vulgaris]|nr:hypothetical protein DFH09DRAFT_1097376 [Mycena vulgaris]
MQVQYAAMLSTDFSCSWDVFTRLAHVIQADGKSNFLQFSVCLIPIYITDLAGMRAALDYITTPSPPATSYSPNPNGLTFEQELLILQAFGPTFSLQDPISRLHSPALKPAEERPESYTANAISPSAPHFAGARLHRTPLHELFDAFPVLWNVGPPHANTRSTPAPPPSVSLSVSPSTYKFDFPLFMIHIIALIPSSSDYRFAQTLTQLVREHEAGARVTDANGILDVHGIGTGNSTVRHRPCDIGVSEPPRARCTPWVPPRPRHEYLPQLASTSTQNVCMSRAREAGLMVPSAAVCEECDESLLSLPQAPPQVEI